MQKPDPKRAISHAICLNGQCFVDQDSQAAMISVTDRGLLLGDGLFETLPILNGHALWWERHQKRLVKSANEIGLPLDTKQITESVKKLCEISQGSNSILRVTVTRGSGGRGLLPAPNQSPTILASLAPLPANLAYQEAKLITCNIRRNEQSPTSRIKSLNYLDNILASQEAERHGADDALMLNTCGMATCSTIGNLFAVFGNQIVTPPISDGVLPGILRGQLLEHSSKWGHELSEDSLTSDQLKKADGLFLTNSLRIMRRVIQLDGRIFTRRDAPEDLISNLQARMNTLISIETGITLA
ncbi:aminotransferase class IV [Cohaesibacter celericrescens]|uniref:Probable branched-chain-amino-acid aminotransferase n=1 Tax=Cohaesibacter celericrescens TaxID=2067669 RepID=A0A2N5XSD4_9HYPH|nr:aminotransferase class IV [Cohaesibacter celericrescens]PLW77370.1 hypothetical protein C0081_08490 [Cohaesibacter celericrescens]